MNGTFEVTDDIDLPTGDYRYIGEGLYIIKDSHYVYLCEKKHGSEEWPRGFRRVATLTPSRLKAIRELSMRLSGYLF